MLGEERLVFHPSPQLLEKPSKGKDSDEESLEEQRFDSLNDEENAQLIEKPSIDEEESSNKHNDEAANTQ